MLFTLFCSGQTESTLQLLTYASCVRECVRVFHSLLRDSSLYAPREMRLNGQHAIPIKLSERRPVWLTLGKCVPSVTFWSFAYADAYVLLFVNSQEDRCCVQFFLPALTSRIRLFFNVSRLEGSKQKEIVIHYNYVHVGVKFYKKYLQQ